jgi:RNA polymerase sigma factor (sigma-70 family)
MAQRKLVADNANLVNWYIYQKTRRDTRSAHLSEDLEQEGYLGLMQAATLFDESRGVKFSTYAVFFIRAYVNRAAFYESRASSRRNSLSFESATRALGHHDEDATIARLELESRLNTALARLESRGSSMQVVMNAEKILTLMCSGFAVADIARCMRLSRERIRQMLVVMGVNTDVTHYQQ